MQFVGVSDVLATQQSPMWEIFFSQSKTEAAVGSIYAVFLYGNISSADIDRMICANNRTSRVLSLFFSRSTCVMRARENI